jgi:hypothetical protein
MIDLQWDSPSEELEHRHLSEGETNTIREISDKVFPFGRQSYAEFEGRRENGCFVYESPSLVAGMFIDGQSGDTDAWLYRVGRIRTDLGGRMEPPSTYDETIAEGFSSPEESVRAVALLSVRFRVENVLRSRALKDYYQEIEFQADQFKNDS